MNSTSTTAGGTIGFTLANGPGNPLDWVSLYCPATQPDNAYLGWQYLNGMQGAPAVGLTGATLTFPVPATLTPGATCNVRWWANNALTTRLALGATVTVAYPVPAITAISPVSLAATSPAFTLTVTGTGFASGAVVQLDGTAKPTTFVSATQLTAAIPATDVASVGTHTITVVNPTPGGGASNGVTLTVTTPPAAPTLSSISPTSVSAGGAAFTLTATGSGFAGNSVVQVNGAGRVTTFVSATQLTATILASDIASGGTAAITVFTPAPGGGTSSPSTLTVIGPTVTVPATATAGSPLSVTVANGPGNPMDWLALFCPPTQPDTAYTAWEYLNGMPAPPAVGLAAATVSFLVPATLAPGATCNVRWFANNTTTRLATSGTATVAYPVPAITAISPASLAAGSAAFTLTVTGTGFVAGTVVNLDGAPRTLAFVSATQMTAAIPASDVASVGTHTITVVNPTPGGGTSNGVTLTMTPPPAAPTLSSISPTSVSAGGAAFPLTVTGTNFVGTSVVQVNGSARATTVGSATSLTATILASDIASGGTPAITVMTPAPGGGVSSGATLTVIGPSLDDERDDGAGTPMAGGANHVQQ